METKKTKTSKGKTPKVQLPKYITHADMTEYVTNALEEVEESLADQHDKVFDLEHKCHHLIALAKLSKSMFDDVHAELTKQKRYNAVTVVLAAVGVGLLVKELALMIMGPLS